MLPAASCFFFPRGTAEQWPAMAAILTNCRVFECLLESALIKDLQTDRILREGPGTAPVNYLSLWRNKYQVMGCVGRNADKTNKFLFITLLIQQERQEQLAHFAGS